MCIRDRRDIATEKAFKNAITVDMALGCSTNTSLHIPAIAHEAGIKIDLREFNRISEVTPNLCHLAPAGEHFMEELDAAGGVRAVMKELDGIGPVSYTHLDVYKRQQIRRAVCTQAFHHVAVSPGYRDIAHACRAFRRADKHRAFYLLHRLADVDA